MPPGLLCLPWRSPWMSAGQRCIGRLRVPVEWWIRRSMSGREFKWCSVVGHLGLGGLFGGRCYKLFSLINRIVQ